MVATLLIFLGLIAISKEVAPSFIEMQVKGVRLDTIGNTPVVFLADKEGKKALPIWVGLLEANAIDKELRNETSPRPMTHDLLYSIIVQTHAKVKEVRIVGLKENTYYATLFLKWDKRVVEVDARPSDAIVIALKSKAPIFVSVEILEQQGIALISSAGFGERLGIRVQGLTPALANSFNFKGKNGVLVAEILPGGASESSGLKPGDIITKINSKEVGTVQQFEELFDSAKPGDLLKMELFRDGNLREISLPGK